MIGTNQAGSAPLPNLGPGVLIQEGSTQNTLDRNVISGNALGGVTIKHSGTTGNTLSGNLIGLDAAGNGPLGNAQDGVLITEGASQNVIGTGVPYNAISGNARDGIRLSGTGTNGNTIQFCVIGTNSSGGQVVANQGNGVTIEASTAANTVGGPFFFLPSNVIAANLGSGVRITGAGTTANSVLGNMIGLSLDNAPGLGNAGGGVLVDDGATFTVLGDDSPLQNVISGNAGFGVMLDAVTDVQMQGNLIGLGADGISAVANTGTGVIVNATGRLLLGRLSGHGSQYYLRQHHGWRARVGH